MKRMTALLTVPFLALACSDAEQATLLEPAAISTDVTIEAAPLPGIFTVEVRYGNIRDCLSNPLATQTNGDWTLPVGQRDYCVRMKVNGGNPGGTIFVQTCRKKRDPGKGNWVPKASCEAGTGKWETVRKMVPLSQFTGAQAFSPNTYGWQLAYKGQGSGVKNAKILFDVIRPAS